MQILQVCISIIFSFPVNLCIKTKTTIKLIRYCLFSFLGGNPNSTPKPVRKRPLVDSPSTARVLREVRRGTVFKPPTYVMRRDDDMDFGVAFQTAEQAAHNERRRFEEGIEMEIQNELAHTPKQERNH